MDNIIKVGAVVKTLKHRHKMSIYTVKKGIAVCDYFDKDENGKWNELHREEYPIEELEHISSNLK